MRWIFFILFFGVLEWYAFQAIKASTNQRIWWWLYLSIATFLLINLFIGLLQFDRSRGFSTYETYSFGLFFAMAVFQLMVGGMLLLEDLIRGMKGLINIVSQTTTSDNLYLPKRRAFISQLAIALGMIPSGALIYGMLKGKYNYQVLRYTLTYDDLPQSFDGYQITQISDIHSGSFDNAEKVQYGIDLINQQESDIILFTGDLVNNIAKEMRPWQNQFSTLSARHGVFSVLGNHDYGDYYQWPSEQDKVDNMNQLSTLQKEMGWTLLRNEHHFIQRGKERLALLGVENWGTGFKRAGDLEKTLENVEEKDFKILMSHDPSHWEAQVLPHAFPIHLTLSGHTHGMQFGIEIPGWIKWSPVKWRYKQWAGVYEKGQQKINVNRGFGFLAYPGRFGMWPEISVITLRRSKTAV
ncbi:MAG: metallophosphoesterase [Flavobacteriaceae bacterium]|nr:metallophosphoesterase [Flavobacteriaceae bacterium]